MLTAKSTVGHGIHSPFVYELATKVLKSRTDSKFVEIETLRAKLIKDFRTISVTDLGAGSRKSNKPLRTIASIAKTSLKPQKYASLIAHLAKHQKCDIALELGTSLGLTSAYLSKVCNKVITIEGCKNIASVAKENHKNLSINNIEIKVGNFDDLLVPTLTQNPNCTLVYIDGNHTYQATMHYYYQLRKLLPNHALLIFDDIYWSEEMLKAWRKITSETTNQITIDLFHLGLVYLKKDQATENFKIRI